MTPGKELRRCSGRSTIAALAVSCALAALPATAYSSDSSDDPLSPRLAELAKPSVRAASHAAQARKLSLAPSGPGSLLRQGSRVIVDVRFDEDSAPNVDALRAVGAQVVAVSRRYRTVTIAATPASLPRLSGLSHVEAVTEELVPIVYSLGSVPVVSTAATCMGGFGAATSEGDLQLNAMQARTEFGVDGSGVTVGVLSDSYDQDDSVTTAAEDVASGDLPGFGNPCGRTTPVTVLDDLALPAGDESATDEGRAMAQIVHDLAPGASLAFATAFKGEFAFAQNIEKLAKPTAAGGAGAKVIVDDVSYFDEPFFQDGPVAAAVSKVTGEGVAYFSSAGNNNLIDSGGRNIASWEAPAFRDSSSCPAPLPAISGLNATHCMDFDPTGATDNTFGITVSGGAELTLDLQWAEPWEGVSTDLDAFLIDSSNTVIAESADNNPGVTEVPYELLSWENTSASARTVRLAVNRFIGTGARLKVAFLQNGGGVTAVEYPSSAGTDVVGPTIFGHNGGADAMSVGAIRFSATTSPETFSSRGPVTHYFGPFTGAGAAAAIPVQTLHKPDIVATDGGANTFFGSCVSSTWRFFGTSAAAPHAAAAAALELDEAPGASVAQVKQAQVNTTTNKLGAFSIDAVGAGLLDASAALGQLHGSNPGGGTAAGPGFAPPACPPTPKTPVEPVTPVPPDSPVDLESTASAGAPSTSFALRPHRVIRTHAGSAFVSFRFRSDQDSSFLCSIDGGAFRPCHRKLARWFSLGPHSVGVAARNAAGETDPTPAVFHFRVKRGG